MCVLQERGGCVSGQGDRKWDDQASRRLWCVLVADCGPVGWMELGEGTGKAGLEG